MLPLLAALPSIFSVVSKVSDLFSKGKESVEKVTGSKSIASSPDELQQEVQSLPPAQQAQWAQIMRQKVEMYQAENQRLDIEIGTIDSNITGKLSAEKASEIAYLRMATRPWTVKWMVYYILFPFALVTVDLVQNIIKNWFLFWTDKIQPFKTFDYVFGSLNPAMLKDAEPGVLDKIVQVFSGHAQLTFAGDLYVQSIPWVVGIIVSYMGLREIGKIKGASSDYPTGSSAISAPQPSAANVVSTVLTTGADLVGKVRKIFGK